MSISGQEQEANFSQQIVELSSTPGLSQGESFQTYAVQCLSKAYFKEQYLLRIAKGYKIHVFL
jgi:hypothetical protein